MESQVFSKIEMQALLHLPCYNSNNFVNCKSSTRSQILIPPKFVPCISMHNRNIKCKQLEIFYLMFVLISFVILDEVLQPYKMTIEEYKNISSKHAKVQEDNLNKRKQESNSYGIKKQNVSSQPIAAQQTSKIRR